MRRSTRIPAVLAVGVLAAFAACGEEEPAPATTEQGNAAESPATTTTPGGADEQADDGGAGDGPADGAPGAPTPKEQEELIERTQQGYEEIREAAASGDLAALERVRERVEALREEFCGRPDVPQRLCREPGS
jgi:hypothetical protein